MTDTLFTRIIRGEIPSFKVYEDALVYSFLDIHPVATGHTLVVPKEPAVTLDALSDDSAAALGRALPRICRAVQKATGVSAFNVLQNNGPEAHQAVPHVHFHIIPKPEEKQGLGIGWSARSLEPEQGKQLAAEIARWLQA